MGKLAAWRFTGLVMCDLSEEGQTTGNPYIVRMPDGTEIKRLYYTCIMLAEMSMQELRALGLDGLLPLIPLTKDGGTVPVIDQLADELTERKLTKLIPFVGMFTWFRFKEKVDAEWLMRRFFMREDVLEDAPFVQEWKRLGAEAERAHTLKVNSDALLSYIRTRYPDLEELAIKVVKDVKEPDTLTTATIKIALAQDEKTVIKVLSELAS